MLLERVAGNLKDNSSRLCSGTESGGGGREEAEDDVQTVDEHFE